MRKTNLYRICSGFMAVLCFNGSAVNGAELTDDSARDTGTNIMYINPEVTTYEPVSRANLVYSGACVIALPPIAVIKRIDEIFMNSDYGPFDDARVRVRIENQSGSIFIDTEGGMFSESRGNSKKMSKHHFLEFKALFAPLNRKDGCRSLGRWPYRTTTR